MLLSPVTRAPQAALRRVPNCSVYSPTLCQSPRSYIYLLFWGRGGSPFGCLNLLLPAGRASAQQAHTAPGRQRRCAQFRRAASAPPASTPHLPPRAQPPHLIRDLLRLAGGGPGLGDAPAQHGGSAAHRSAPTRTQPPRPSRCRPRAEPGSGRKRGGASARLGGRSGAASGPRSGIPTRRGSRCAFQVSYRRCPLSARPRTVGTPWNLRRYVCANQSLSRSRVATLLTL